MIDLSIVVVSYRSKRELPSMLSSVADAAGDLSWHVTIVNNDASEDLGALADADERITVVPAGGNLGYSGGLNVGLREGPASRLIAFLNPDLTLFPESLSQLAHALTDGNSAAVPLIRDTRGGIQDSLRREPTLLSAMGEAVFGDRWPDRPQVLAEVVRRDGAYRSSHAVDWATGAALVVRADVVRRVGLWDEETFFMYSEETDYARRIRADGGRIVFVPDSVVEHRSGGSGSSAQLDALLEVNKLRYFRKWHGPVASVAFSLVLLLRNAVRLHRPGSRATITALVSRRARAALPGGAR